MSVAGSLAAAAALPPQGLALPQGVAWWLVLGAYLLGSVPFGLVLVRLVKGVDLREIGSGNIGATNAMRAGGRPLGVLVFLLDFGKGWLPAAAPLWLPALEGGGVGLQVLAGAAAVLGHCFPVVLKFKGGKGVATGCGALVAIDPVVWLVGGVVWLVTIAATRYTGLASMLMGVTFPIAAYWRSVTAGPREPGGGAGLPLVVGASALALLILVRHRSNIGRMLAGTESRVGRKSS